MTYESWRSIQGQRPNAKSSNVDNYSILPMERFEIFTICRRPPILQTDFYVGMMKIVVRETDVCKLLGL